MLLNAVRPGVVCVLASGGPKMTAVAATDDMVTCIWFVGEALKRGVFPIDALMRVTDVNKLQVTFVRAGEQTGSAANA